MLIQCRKEILKWATELYLYALFCVIISHCPLPLILFRGSSTWHHTSQAARKWPLVSLCKFKILKFPCFPESVKFPACLLHWQHHQMALSIIRVKTLFLFYVGLLCIVHPVSVSSSHFGCPPTTHPLTCESKFRLVSSQTSPAGAYSASY